MRSGAPRIGTRGPAPLLRVGFLAALFLIAAFTLTSDSSAQDIGARSTSAQQPQSGDTSANPVVPRGIKLVLKDGSLQLVREYKVEGDRVRFYSLERSDWEVIPADLVDWDATKKLETEQAEHDAALLTKVRTQEAERVIAPPLDIDASLEVAPGVFLPPGDHLFEFDGKSVLALPQAEISSKVSKGRLLEQIMVPVPIIPSRQDVSIQGARSKFRVQTNRPEFYMRTANGREPQIDLVHAKTQGNTRLIEHLDELMGERHEVRNSVPLEKWEVAKGVFRFTLGQPLPSGEYALAEILDDGVSMYVWDFGLDAQASSSNSSKATK